MLKKRIYHYPTDATPVSSLCLKGSIFALLIFSLLVNSNIVRADENVPAADTDQQAKQTEQSNMGSVARAVFTSQIIDREPADEVTTLTNDIHRVYFFTDLRDMAGQIITHRWEHNGDVMAEVKFKVGEGPRWRVYSSKNLLPEWTGEWKVSVVNEGGDILATGTFEYMQAASQEQPETSEMPAEKQTP